MFFKKIHTCINDWNSFRIPLTPTSSLRNLEISSSTPLISSDSPALTWARFSLLCEVLFLWHSAWTCCRSVSQSVSSSMGWQGRLRLRWFTRSHFWPATCPQRLHLNPSIVDTYHDFTLNTLLFVAVCDIIDFSKKRQKMIRILKVPF